jgi:hypothetical protein
MVDAEDPLLREAPVQPHVEVPGGGEVMAEGLFDHQAGVAREPGGGEPLGDDGEQRRRHGQVVGEEGSTRDVLGEFGEGGGVGVIAAHQTGAGEQLCQHGLVDRADGCYRVADVLVQLVVVPGGKGDTYDGYGHLAAGGQLVQRRQDQLAGEITGDAEQHQGVGTRTAHVARPLQLR